MSHPKDEMVADALRKKGWSVLTKGWPDLLCFRRPTKDRPTIMAIELKRGADRLTPEQATMADLFTSVMGVPHFVLRDAEQEAILKRGKCRTVLPGEPVSLNQLRNEAIRLQHQVYCAVKKMEELDALLAETTVLFDQTPTIAQRHEIEMIERGSEVIRKGSFA